MSIGERIAQLRKDQELSQAQLASMIEVSRQAISKWENDQTSPDTLNLIRLAEALGSDIEYLATGQQTEEPAPEPIVRTVVREVEKVVETVVEKPIIRRRTRIVYRDHPIHLLLLGAGCFLAGLLLGLVF